MAAEKVKLGIIGCGKIATVHHLPAVLALGNKAEIVALFDTKKAAAEKLAETGKLKNVRICRTMAEFIDSGVEAAIVATPNHQHFPLTMACLENGIHVLVEKPMAVSLGEADAMIAAAKKNHLILQVNQTFHFLPQYSRIRDMIRAGKIGKVLTARCLRASTDSPDKTWSPGASWFVRKSSHGGIVMDIAVHMADYMQWCLSPVRQVQAFARKLKKDHQVPDHFSAVMDYADGATGTLDLSWNFGAPANSLEFYGDKGFLRLNTDGTFEISDAKGKAKKLDLSKARVKNSHECFLAAVQGRGEAVSPVLCGRNALALCLAIQESSDQGKPAKPAFSVREN